MRVGRWAGLPLCGLLLLTAVAQGQPWVDTAASYVGVRERTGRNDGEEVERFLAHVGLAPGYAWCAAFVSYCLDRGGADSPPRSAWCPSLMGGGVAIDPRGGGLAPGDVFGVYHGAKGRVAHVGFIEGVEGDWVVTIEGNTNRGGGREGDGVYRRRRRRGSLWGARRWYSREKRSYR